MTSCVNVIICIDSFWSLCAESVNGGTDVVIKGQWTMTTGILIGGISGVRPQESDQGCYWYKGNLIFFRQIQ